MKTIVDTLVGFAAYDEDRTLRAIARFPETLDLPEWRYVTWTITSVETTIRDTEDTQVHDFGFAFIQHEIPAHRIGPFIITHLALLRADATPIDAREIEHVIVPDGSWLDVFHANVRIELP